jgi:hypothetical protein
VTPKEGAHGGTMGSPVRDREDAPIIWRDRGQPEPEPEREPS